MAAHEALVEEYCVQLRRRQIEGSMPCAKRTAEIMRGLVTMQKHPDAASLIDDVRSVGYKLQAANPVELAIGNIVRRVLHLIREEALHDASDEASAESVVKEDVSTSQPVAGPIAQASRFQNRTVSLSNLLDVGINDLDVLLLPDDKPRPEPSPASETESIARRKVRSTQWKRKQHIIEAINELIDELDNIQQSITIQGVEHIHAKEVILTLGMSDTTYYFLKEASKKRDFQVVVAEGCPRYDGHLMAKKLADAGVQTTLISDSAVFAMMARANKVLVGAHAVLANGGVIVPCGINMVALAARKHSVPFVVLVGLHKLSPLFPHDPDLTYNDFKSPADVVDYDVLAEAFSCQDPAASSQPSQGGQPQSADLCGPTVHVPSPTFDYVPPHLISLFVTDMGGYTPSYVYRLLAEFYDRNDYLLSKQLVMGS